MDYTLMIIAKDGTLGGGYGLTSQLKSFPTKGQAEYVLEAINAQKPHMTNRIEVLRLYNKDGQ